jgi:hypothetical protein
MVQILQIIHETIYPIQNHTSNCHQSRAVLPLFGSNHFHFYFCSHIYFYFYFRSYSYLYYFWFLFLFTLLLIVLNSMQSPDQCSYWNKQHETHRQIELCILLFITKHLFKQKHLYKHRLDWLLKSKGWE